jgi:hypothetical protein
LSSSASSDASNWDNEFTTSVLEHMKVGASFTTSNSCLVNVLVASRNAAAAKLPDMYYKYPLKENPFEYMSFTGGGEVSLIILRRGIKKLIDTAHETLDKFLCGFRPKPDVCDPMKIKDDLNNKVYYLLGSVLPIQHYRLLFLHRCVHSTVGS